jgi:chromosome segregation ATPase
MNLASIQAKKRKIKRLIMVKKTKVDRIRNKLSKEDKEFKRLVAYLQPSVSYIDVMGQHLNALLENSKLRKEKADFSRFRHKFAPVKDRMDKLLHKQNELFAKLKELETENLKLRYAVNKDRASLNRYKNIDMPLNREIAQLKEKLDDSNKTEIELKHKIRDIYHQYCYDSDDDGYYEYDDD